MIDFKHNNVRMAHPSRLMKLNHIPPLAPRIIDDAISFTRSRAEQEREKFNRALEIALSANSLVQGESVVLPTLEELMTNFLGGQISHFNGSLVQDRHTTSSMNMSRFHQGRILTPDGKVLGYSHDWSRFGTTCEIMDDSGPLRASEFWGLMQTRNPNGTGVATPLLGIMEEIEGPPYQRASQLRDSENKSRWGFKLSEDWKNPDYFVPFTDWLYKNSSLRSD